MPLTKLENFSEPLVDIEKQEIEFYEFFDRSDRQEVKAWIEKIGELIKKISATTAKNIRVFEYFGMGQGDYYYLDLASQCRVINSEDLKYGKGPTIEYAREIVYDESFDQFTLLMPGRREVLAAAMRQ
ncbi:hypothetical protein [Estrella lausannensis]|uniref:Uncharacterized protein n=1 Tax=Estrella lausannensis TaxID=483423 RepID=A0A0H5E4S7_9BACT|nr:hypothetical protein [Estrella lausannensis]CRX38250.1 hypothetical protein ELAC_0901 [Estrella lausannensis]